METGSGSAQSATVDAGVVEHVFLGKRLLSGNCPSGQVCNGCRLFRNSGSVRIRDVRCFHGDRTDQFGHLRYHRS